MMILSWEIEQARGDLEALQRVESGYGLCFWYTKVLASLYDQRRRLPLDNVGSRRPLGVLLRDCVRCTTKVVLWEV